MLDSYLHIHTGEEESSCSLGNMYSGLHLINIHSIAMYYNFINISEELGNKVFFYDGFFTPSSTVIPTGSYSLQSFNKYLDSNPSTALYKVVLSYDGTHYEVVSYANATNKLSDVGRIVQDVNGLSTFNQEIYSGIVWCD